MELNKKEMLEQAKDTLISKIMESIQNQMNKDSSNIKKLEYLNTTLKSIFDDKKVNIFPELQRQKNGELKPIMHSSNIEVLLKDILNINLVYDEVLCELILLDENGKEQYIKDRNGKPTRLKIEYEDLISKIHDEVVKYKFLSDNTNKIESKVNSLCKKNSVDYIRDYILNAYEQKKNENLGTVEIDRIFNSIKISVDKKEISYTLFKTWLSSLISARFNDEFTSHGCLVLCGHQGYGKTRFLRNLMPPELRKYFEGEKCLNTSNKDDVIQLAKKWLVELSEIGRSLKDSDGIKAHLTRPYDTFRKPYDRTDKTYKRKTVYASSCDKQEFLKDDVNRRFWIIEIFDRFDEIEIDYIQLYAELYNIYLQNPLKCHLLSRDIEEQLNKENVKYKVKNELESNLDYIFDIDSEHRYLMTIEQIGGYLNISNTKSNTTKLGIILGKTGKNIDYEVRNKKTKQKLYHMPPIRKAYKQAYEAFNETKHERIIKEVIEPTKPTEKEIKEYKSILLNEIIPDNPPFTSWGNKKSLEHIKSQQKI